jgi:hypothetical protein
LTLSESEMTKFRGAAPVIGTFAKAGMPLASNGHDAE